MGKVEIWQCICPLSWSVHDNFVRDGRYSERGWTSPASADFSIVMECAPKGGHCHCELCAISLLSSGASGDDAGN
jgi:hypothetical protein